MGIDTSSYFRVSMTNPIHDGFKWHIVFSQYANRGVSENRIKRGSLGISFCVSKES